MTTAADIVAGLAMGVVREKVDGFHNGVHRSGARYRDLPLRNQGPDG